MVSLCVLGLHDTRGQYLALSKASCVFVFDTQSCQAVIGVRLMTVSIVTSPVC